MFSAEHDDGHSLTEDEETTTPITSDEVCALLMRFCPRAFLVKQPPLGGAPRNAAHPPSATSALPPRPPSARTGGTEGDPSTSSPAVTPAEPRASGDSDLVEEDEHITMPARVLPGVTTTASGAPRDGGPNVRVAVMWVGDTAERTDKLAC